MPISRLDQRSPSDQATDGSANEGPADSTDNASHLESRTESAKPSLFKRVSGFLSPTFSNNTISSPSPAHAWRAFHPTHVGLHLTLDPHPETNTNHRKLPEEHRAAHEEAQRMALVQQQHLLQPPRELRGPVPRNRVGTDGHAARRSTAEHISEFRLSMDLDFLAPVERDVLHAMRRTRPSSHFRPLMTPHEEILLVHEGDYEVIRQVQNWIRPLPFKEKSTLAADLYDFLKEEKRYMLKLLLFHPAIRVTTKSRGQGLGMEEAEGPIDTTQNVVSFAQSVGSFNSGGQARGRKSNDTTQTSSGSNRTKTFELRSEPISTLRGGGDGDDRNGMGSARSSSSYVSFLRGSKYDRLNDDEKVPSAMWWLAGGRGSFKGRQPTAGEMRERRRAEIQNREQVHFLGTLFGRRAFKMARPAPREVEEYRPADERQDTKPQVDNEADVVKAPEATPATALDHSKAPASTPGLAGSVNDHAGSQNQEESSSTSKSPALSILSNVSDRKQPAQLPASENTQTDDGLDRDIEPQSQVVVEQGKRRDFEEFEKYDNSESRVV